MHDQNPHRATILPVSEGTPRPHWSVMVPTYNCAHYLHETLACVLAQDLGPEVMQIEVIDDHSTKDDPEAVVRELGHGRVGFYRQPENVGHVRNFETCLRRSQGKLIHLLHGDDCVRDGFYYKMQSAFSTAPEIGAAFCRHIYMDDNGHWTMISELLQGESGILEKWLERIITRQYIQTPSIVVRREVYEKLGGFDRRFEYYYEDWEMWVRIATTYPVWYEVEPLAIYRQASISNTGFTIRTGKNIEEIRKGNQIVQSYLSSYLSPSTVMSLLNKNTKYYALYALMTAYKMYMSGDISSAVAQIREALKTNLSFEVICNFVFLLTRAFLRSLYRLMKAHFRSIKSSFIINKIPSNN